MNSRLRKGISNLYSDKFKLKTFFEEIKQEKKYIISIRTKLNATKINPYFSENIFRVIAAIILIKRKIIDINLKLFVENKGLDIDNATV